MPSFDYITVRDQVFTQVSAQLGSTEVYKYPIGDQTIKKNTTDDTWEWVEFGELRVARNQETYGLVLDVVELDGLIQVEAPGKSDAKASVAETRAQTLLTAVETGLQTDDELSGNALRAIITNVESTNGVTDRGRATRVEFTIEVESHNG